MFTPLSAYFATGCHVVLLSISLVGLGPKPQAGPLPAVPTYPKPVLAASHGNLHPGHTAPAAPLVAAMSIKPLPISFYAD